MFIKQVENVIKCSIGISRLPISVIIDYESKTHTDISKSELDKKLENTLK